MPAQQESWIATAYLETGTISVGYVACLNAAGTRYVVASSANRTAAGRRSACIALSSADADSAGGSGFEAQYVGAVPPSVSGLGAGSASLIRVATTGLLQRVGVFDPDDDVCGHCDADGTAYVCFPLIGFSQSIGGSVDIQGSQFDIMLKENSATLKPLLGDEGSGLAEGYIPVRRSGQWIGELGLEVPAGTGYLRQAGGAITLVNDIVNVTSTTPGDIAVTGDDTINANAAGAMTITGFTAPAAGEPRTIRVTNNSASDVSFSRDAGGAAANGIMYADSYVLVLGQYEAVTFSYDHNVDRYIPHIGAELAGL